jgi:glycerophosphoryl diester phosphodiesterase
METFQYSDFSIGHRGAALMFPEHTEISWKAAQTMGVGINECDVTFTKDIELVCRHAQCDLHTTTDVVLRPELNAKCTTPWQPNSTTSPKCCTSDFTLAEIKTLCAKMDSSGGNGRATPEQYVFGGTADWRTDLYQYQTTLGNCPRVMKHSESIQIIKSLGGKFTPELKGPEVTMPFNGVYSQEDYAQHMINEYIAAGIPPEDVWPQSFFPADCYYWAANTDYGAQAVALDDQYDRTPAEVEAWMDELIANGVNIVAPPMQKLVDPAPGSPLGMQPSFYARAANEKGLDIITWTLERTPPNLQGFYWESLNAANVPLVAGDKYALLYVLAFQAGILGMFSDWPAPVTFFANCMGLALR